MKKIHKHIKCIILSSLSIISTAVVADQVLSTSINMPRVLNAQEQKPVIKPDSQHQVAVLKLIINSDKGKAQGIKTQSVKIINSYAPKVFARQSKENRDGWKITIKGAKSVSYMVNNPLNDIEIENPDDFKSPYSMVRESGEVEWTLIVPLYKDGESLNAREVMIQDTTNANIKFSAMLDNIKVE